MKNLIIAIILIFAGLNDVQSQVISTRTVTVREIAGGTETLYHVFSDNQSVFFYNPPYSIAQPVNEYPVSITYSPGLNNSVGTVRVNNNDYVISGSYASDLNVIMSDARVGAGDVYNSNRVEQSGIILDVPTTAVQLVLAGWRYSSNRGGTIFSPNSQYDVFYDGGGEWLVSNSASNSTNFDFYATSQQDIITWYNCISAITNPTRNQILACRP